MTTLVDSDSYLKTRLAIMAKKLLRAERIDRLSVQPVDLLAKELGLDAIIQTTLPARLRNRSVERALMSELMHDMEIILRPLSGKARDLIVYWARKFELYNIKALIRGKLNGLDAEEIRDSLHLLPAPFTLPHDELLQAENILELLRRLEELKYRDIARQAREIFEDSHESFSLDAALDQRYCSGLLRKARELQQSRAGAILELIGRVLDHQDLIWVLRYRFSYGLSATETYYLLVPSPGLLKRDLLKKLVTLNRFDDVIRLLPERLRRLLHDIENNSDVEYACERDMLERLPGVIRNSPDPVARSLAYLMRRELDLKRLFAIIQGKVLHLEDALIRRSLGVREGTRTAHR